MSYLHYIPKWYQYLRPNLIWRKALRSDGKALYLSFDDGPIPGITPWVLEQLEDHQAKATFFCIGDNARKHPEVLQEIIKRGHALGNHTMHHLNGAKTSFQSYLDDFKSAQEHVPSRGLFRPPYGRIKKKQARAISRAGYDIIMWDCLAADWDSSNSAEDCFLALKRHAKDGSIIVFHDSIKAWPRLKILLPQILKHYQGAGYCFKSLGPDIL